MGTTITSPTEKVPPGTILMFGATTAPQGYLLCDGNTYANTDYPDLYAAIGTTFGTAGAGTFAVPDFQFKFPFGVDISTNIGDIGGDITHQHSFTPQGLIDAHTSVVPKLGAVVQPVAYLTGPTNHIFTGQAGTTASGNNTPPFLVVNFIIKT